MKKILSAILCLSSFQIVVAQSSTTKNDVHQLYEQQTVIFKIQPQYRSACNVNYIANQPLNDLLQQLGIMSFGKIFPNHQPPSIEKNKSGQLLTDLSLIYQLRYTSNIPVEDAIKLISKTQVCAYVEPRYIYTVNFSPNDPSAAFQYFLTNINAFNAWNVEQGDTNVVIGIVDSGTDWNHPDLQANVKLNYADPINGTDDDNDGYIDNYRGWDISESDNNPMCDALSHGSHVSGCADAVTNNNTGVASPGFNCKFLPVKTAKATSTGTIDNGYEGIVYASDHGCSIINCSWGGPGGGQYGQDAISYATNNHNCLVVASAGNNNTADIQYPAGYKYVLAVASTDQNDIKSSFSSYYPAVDVSAPGSSIYSTVIDDSYTFMGGTSMSSPITAGAAAIVKSHFPAYTGLQVGEQLRVTCDNIYTIPQNNVYNAKRALGNGRINMYQALTVSSPSIRYTDMVFNDHNDNSFVVGDTVRIGGIIRNFLAPTTNLVLTISTTSPVVTIIDNTATVGVLNTLDSTDNYNSPFSFKINPSAPQNAVISFKITMTDGSYTDYQVFDVTVNVDYINITINKTFTTITSKGRIGYNIDGQQQGLGFNYDNHGTLMYDGGLMIGTANGVSDVIRGTATGNDADFQSAVNVSQVIPAVKSDFDVVGKFNDNASTTPLSLLVSHNAYAFTKTGDDKYVIVEYIIKNNGTSTLNGLYAGTCFDWDIQAYANNKSDEVSSIRLGYVWNTDPGGLWAGVKVLTQTGFNHYGIDNVTGGNGGVNVYDGYSTSEKYTTLSTPRAQAGVTGTGNDVLDVVSSGPFNINAGDSVKVAFAIIAGDDLLDLTQSADHAQIAYDSISSPFLAVNEIFTNAEIAVYPNPLTQASVLQINLKTNAVVTVKVLDLQGKVVNEMISAKSMNKGMQSVQLPVTKLTNGIYLLNVTINNEIRNLKLIKM